MKKSIFVIALFLVFISQLSFALGVYDYTINYYYNGAPVNNITVLNYACLDSGCYTLGALSWSSNSGATNTILTRYTIPAPTYGYATYWFAPGYRGNSITWTPTADGAYTINANFTKYSNCTTPNVTINVPSTIIKNVPVSINASVWSSITKAIKAPYADPANSTFVRDFLTSNVSATLIIRNETNDVVFNNTVNQDILHDNWTGFVFANWTPLTNGTHAFNVYTSVDDNKCSNSIQGNGSVDVANTSVVWANGVPTLNNISNLNVTANSTIYFTLTANDPDLHLLTFNVTNLPFGAGLIDNLDNTANFNWTPNETQLGTFVIDIITVDPYNATANQTFTIDVNAIPDLIAPEVNVQTPINDSQINTNQIELNFSAFDSHIDSCWLINSTFERIDLLTCANTTFNAIEGYQHILVYANDTTGNINHTQVDFFVDSIPANLLDLNVYTITNESAEINSTIDKIANATLDIGINDSLGFTIVNATNNTIHGFSLMGLTNQTTYFFNLTFKDYIGHVSVFGPYNFTTPTSPDISAPSLAIDYPLNNSQHNTASIDFNFTAFDQNLESCQIINATGGAVFGCANFTQTVDDGTWNTMIIVNDTWGNQNFTTIFFSVDSSAPTIFIQTPINNSAYNTNLISLNYTVFDTHLDSCWFQNTTGEIESLLLCTNITFGTFEGQNNITLFANDSLNNVNSVQLFFNVDSIYPSITINEPINNSLFATTIIDINFTTADSTLASCGYINATGQTLALAGCANFTQTLTDGFWNVTVYANDSTNNINSTQVFFTIDTTEPSISINSPINQNYTTTNISLNFTVFDSHLDSCNYELNGATNVSLPNCNNVTFLGAQGANAIKLFANDSLDHANYTQVSFFIDSIAPNMTAFFVYDIGNETVKINSTIDELANATVEFGTNLVLGSFAANNTIDVEHSFSLTNLQNSTTYYFNITFEDDFGNKNTFGSFNFTTLINPDNSSPMLAVETPINASMYNSLNITLKYTALDPNIETCAYVNSTGSYILLTNCTNATIGLIEGLNNITVFANDTYGNINFTQVFFTVDTTQTAVAIDIPPNNSIYGTSTVDVNFTASDANLDTCKIINATGGIIFGCANFTQTLADGFWNVSIITNDSANNINTTNVFFTIDTNAPQLSLQSPLNNSGFNVAQVPLNYMAQDLHLDSCWYQNVTGNYLNLANCVNATINAIDGTNNITLFTNDSVNNIRFTQVFFIVDTTAPSLLVQSPLNLTQFNTNVVYLNYSVTDNVALDKCWFTNSTGGINTLPSCVNTSFIAQEGLNNITIFANDTSNNVNSSTIIFSVDTIAPALNIVEPTNNSKLNTSITQIKFNAFDLNLDSCQIVNATGGIIFGCANFTQTLADGSWNVSIIANDSANNINATNVFFIIDTVAPIINPESTLNNSIFGTNTVSINFTINEANLDSCWITNTTGQTLALAGCANFTQTTTNGFWNVSIYSNDTAGNINLTQIFYYVDADFPRLNIQSPINGTLFGTNLIDLKYEAFDSFPSTCNYVNATGQTLALLSCANTTFNLTDGTWGITLNFNDSLNRLNTTQLLFGIDTTNPIIMIGEPQNKNYTSTNISLNATIFDAHLDSCKYELNGESNVSIVGCTNTTFTGIQGINVIKLFVNDSLNHISNMSQTFFIDSIPPAMLTLTNYNLTNESVKINSSVNETANVTIDFGITTALGTVVENNTLGLNHAFDLINLQNSSIYYYNVTFRDIYGNQRTYGPFNFTTKFNPDTSAPILLINFPNNNSIFNVSTVSINFTANDPTVDSCWITNATGQTLALAGCANFTQTLADGFWNVTVYANDSFNNLNFTNIFFTTDITNPSTSYSANTDLEWYVNSGATITLNATDVNFNNTNYCVYDAGSTPCTTYTTSTNRITELNLSCGANSACQEFVRFYSVDLASHTELTQTTIKIQIVNGSFANLTNATKSNITDNSYIFGSYLENSNATNSSVIYSTEINSTIISNVLKNTTIRSSYLINLSANNSQVFDSNIFGAGCTLVNSTLRNVSFNLSESCYIKNEIHTDELVFGDNFTSITGDPTGNNITATNFISINSTYDFNNIMGSDVVLVNSTVNSSDLTNTNTTNSALTNDTFIGCNLLNSDADDSYGFLCRAYRSTMNSTVVQNSTLNNSIAINSTIQNSTVSFSNISLGELNNASVSGANILDSTINNSNANNTLLTNSTIFGSNVEGGSVNNSNVIGSNSSQVNIVNSNTTNSTLTNSTIFGSNIDGSNVTGGSINNSTLDGASTQNSTLLNTNLQNSTANNSIVLNTNVTNGDLFNSNVTGGSINNSTIEGSNLNNASIGNSNLQNSTANNSVISNSTINGGSIFGSNVTGSNMSNVLLNGGSVNNSTLNDVNLTNVSVSNSSLSNITVLNGNVTDGQIQNGSTVLIGNQTFIVNGTSNVTTYTNHGPIASFSAPTSGTAGASVSFTSTTTDVDVGGPLGDSVSYYWIFGDGATSSVQSPTHAYSLQGNYTIILTATDSFGLKSNASANISIAATSGGSGDGGSGGGSGGSGGSGISGVQTIRSSGAGGAASNDAKLSQLYLIRTCLKPTQKVEFYLNGANKYSITLEAIEDNIRLKTSTGNLISWDMINEISFDINQKGYKNVLLSPESKSDDKACFSIYELRPEVAVKQAIPKDKNATNIISKIVDSIFKKDEPSVTDNKNATQTAKLAESATNQNKATQPITGYSIFDKLKTDKSTQKAALIALATALVGALGYVFWFKKTNTF